VLKDYNQVLDVSADDLEALFLQTEMAAFRRRFGSVRCGQIMARDVVSVAFGTELDEAWRLMERHALSALPVIDRARRVQGIVTRADFLPMPGRAAFAAWNAGCSACCRPAPSATATRPRWWVRS
jgi:CBS domain-containing membrane protein